MPGSPILYGCTLLDGDGTYTALCIECTQTFLPLDAEARRSKWPASATLLADVHKSRETCAANDPTLRNQMRCVAVHHNTVCTADARVVCDAATVRTTPFETLTYEEGLRRSDAYLQTTGQIGAGLPAARMVFDAATARAEWQDARTPLPTCAACGHSPTAASGATELIFMPTCGRCRLVRYCNVACQRAHWSAHRASCAPAK
jgi:hypothetical protein